MPLNYVKSGSDMYGWIDATWNPKAGGSTDKGPCKDHDCSYCWMKDLIQRPVIKGKYTGQHRLVEKELKLNLKRGLIIFVQDCGDLFGKSVPAELIERVLTHCRDYPLNTYLLQTKNPGRLKEFENYFPPRVLLGTTIETDEYYNKKTSKAPIMKERADALAQYIQPTMVSIEPIIRFRLGPLVDLIRKIRPEFVSIGADSGNNGLKEPSAEEIDALVMELGKFTEVRLKPNLKRLVGVI